MWCFVADCAGRIALAEMHSLVIMRLCALVIGGSFLYDSLVFFLSLCSGNIKCAQARNAARLFSVACRRQT